MNRKPLMQSRARVFAASQQRPFKVGVSELPVHAQPSELLFKCGSSEQWRNHR